MNAVVFDRLNHLQFCEDYPMPVCRPGWAVVKVMSAGICATDLEILSRPASSGTKFAALSPKQRPM